MLYGIIRKGGATYRACLSWRRNVKVLNLGIWKSSMSGTFTAEDRYWAAIKRQKLWMSFCRTLCWRLGRNSSVSSAQRKVINKYYKARMPNTMKLSLFERIRKLHHKGNSCFEPGGVRVFIVSPWHCPGYHFHSSGIILSGPQLLSQRFELCSFVVPLRHCTETKQVWKMVACQKWTNSLCLLVMRNTNGSRKLV